MKAPHTEKKELLLLWVSIIREIHPGKHTQNPYLAEMKQLNASLSLAEKIIFKELVHCITLINKASRTNEKGEIISNQSDVINALALVLPKEKQLNKNHLDSLEKLAKALGSRTFTYEQAGVVLRCSHSTVKRLFKVLIFYELVVKKAVKEGVKTVLQINPNKKGNKNTIAEKTEKENPFESAFEQWEDFAGYYDTQMRT